MVVLSSQPEPKFGLAKMLLISITTSVATSFGTTAVLLDFFDRGNAPSLDLEMSVSTSTTVGIECAPQVYSPVQNKCVDQSVFDQEMITLFNALGLNTAIYQPASK